LENSSLLPNDMRILLCILLVYPVVTQHLNAQNNAHPPYAPPCVPTFQEQQMQQEQRNRQYLQKIGHTVPPTREEIIANQQQRSMPVQIPIRYLSEIDRYPDVRDTYLKYYRYMESLSRLGIQDLPESEYLRMLAYYDDKSRLQIARKVNAKTKKSLFIDP